MGLSRFAVMVPATPKWIQNAAAGLGLKLRYTPEEARRLGLARLLHEELGVKLSQAWAAAGRALDRGRGEVTARVTPDGAARLAIDMDRYLSDFAGRLSLARTHYEPRRRGRPARRPARSAVARAREYGLDITLLEWSLRLSPAGRLRRLNEHREFVRALRAASPR